MGDNELSASDESRNRSMGRRRFLRAAGAAGVATAAPLVASGTAAGQQQYAHKMMIPRVERFTKDYVGRFLVLSDPLQREPKTDVLKECDFVNWSPQQTDVYEALIVDRHQTQEAVTVQDVYIKAGTEYPPGTIFVIGEQEMCPKGYVGVVANRIPESRFPPINNSSRQTVGNEGTTEGADGGGVLSTGQPGFGPLAALSGIAGTAWYLARGDDES